MTVYAVSAANDTDNENLNTNTDQDRAAKNGCFPGKASTESLTDAQPAGTDNKSYLADNETGGKSLDNMIWRSICAGGGSHHERT